MGDTTDDPTDELGPPRTYGPDLWKDTGFGPALGGLLVAFLGAWGMGTYALSSYAVSDAAAYRFVSGLVPILMGVAGVALGWLTLRRREDGLARAIAAAAIVVGVLAVVTGALGWWGRELIHHAQSQ